MKRERSKRQPTHSLRRSAYSHEPYVDTLYVLTPRRRRPKLVLTGTSIPKYLITNQDSQADCRMAFEMKKQSMAWMQHGVQQVAGCNMQLLIALGIMGETSPLTEGCG